MACCILKNVYFMKENGCGTNHGNGVSQCFVDYCLRTNEYNILYVCALQGGFILVLIFFIRKFEWGSNRGSAYQ